MFIRKRPKVETWRFWKNNFTATELSSIFQTLSENNTMKNLHVKENTNYKEYQEKKTIIGGVKQLLLGSPSLCYFQFIIYDMEDFETALIKLVEKHPSLLYLKTRNKKIKNKKNIYTMLQSMLQKRYDQELSLNELQLLFMGDGKTGKTSTIRSLCKKRFMKDISSTLVLEDTNIFEIQKDDLKSLTKYELSVQRVKNVLAIEYDSSQKVGNTSKFNLPFEKELLERTVQDEEFFKLFSWDDSSDYKSNNPFYRVSDFGGQEVFSSLHHLFMNPNAVYVVVFNLTKQNNKDMNRLKLWLKSVVKNAPRAPIILIGTYLKLFLRKNKKEELEKTELKVFKLVSETFADFQVIKIEKISFFPIENSNPSSRTISEIHKELKRFAEADIFFRKYFWTELSLPCVWVLFLDNCREESNYLSVKNFKNKGKLCKFTEENLDDMLDIYSRAGIVFYQNNLELSEETNFIFFAPSYIAQALGSFIRDSSLHQLAFRLNSDIFPEYRKYIDFGIIRKTLFNMLLREYTKEEREYVLKVALSSMILLKYDEKAESFIVPELIPILKDSRIKPSTETGDYIKFEEPISLTTFLNKVLQYKNEHQPRDIFLYRYFARFIFDPDRIVDMFLLSEKKLGLKLVKKTWLQKSMDILRTRTTN
eukprot:snap_masked-scaffold_63-processed-gene-0.38-mRNA-1 protein AED:0.23 eAED:0.23 QI:0/0.33/0/0.5/1/1/4/0/647